MPKISVIMGCYNAEKFMDKAIQSIINQTYTDWEFIICDDGSTDRTYEKILKWQKKDERIVSIQNKKNLGLAKSLNNCIKISKSEFIARMDADDYSYENRLKEQLIFLEQQTKYSFCGCNVNYFDDNGIWGKSDLKKEVTKEMVFKANQFIHPTIFIRKDALLDVGKYTVEKYTYRTEDYDLWCKLYNNDYIGTNMERIFLNYREDNESLKKRKFKYRLDAYKLRILWRKQMKLPFYYSIYALKPIIAGLIPQFIILRRHKQKFQNKNQ